MPDPATLAQAYTLDLSDTTGFGRILRPRLALHLYKYKNPDISDANLEADIIIEDIRSHYINCFLTSKRNHDLRGVRVEIIDDLKVIKFHKWAHYLSSPRAGLFNIGLFAQDDDESSIPIAVATLSKFDINHLIRDTSKIPRALVVSRLISFDWSPVNSLSFLLARAADWTRRHMPDIDIFTSYLDSNVGFGGSTYKALGARVISIEKKSSYLYYKGRYISDREAISRFGTNDPHKLSNVKYLEKSQYELKPLLLYAWKIRTNKPQRTQETLDSILGISSSKII